MPIVCLFAEAMYQICEREFYISLYACMSSFICYLLIFLLCNLYSPEHPADYHCRVSKQKAIILIQINVKVIKSV